ncbi:hypothetical protein VHEMI06879 [[Torrubiella] hemipterigena]|uniref:BSD domain-containing protein n=1 Tax=[Torrubiella] hemipterigena TaxID=1531966 RepID=A0A0A1T1V5_9HYPO|nr:hypothetical protein VHEMI06879 [[Torrubiella] hemipterigena]
MDLATFDHLQEGALPSDPQKSEEAQSSLNNDIQDAYKAFSSSPWGAKIGGFFGSVVKQGESVYNQASKELAEVGEDATKGFADLRESILNRTRSLSVAENIGDEAAGDVKADGSKAVSGEPSAATENDSILTRLRTGAAKRLKDLQRAEDAADEALLKFGGNVRDFLRDAITVAAPEGSDESSILFESKDSEGKRVIHASRFDAQMHVIHTSTKGLLEEPAGEEYTNWAKDFDAESKTDAISSDLEKYPELRSTMEKLVPDQVPYAEFWTRYYFLRHGLEAAELRRRELLKAASAEDEVGWDSDSDDEADAPKGEKTSSVTSSTTIHPPAAKLSKSTSSKQPTDTKSQADSEASYDVVGAQSGLQSQAATSPKEAKKDEESDDDWE